MWPFSRKPKSKKPEYNIIERKEANGNIYYKAALVANWMEQNDYQMLVSAILREQKFGNIEQAKRAIIEAEIETNNLHYSKIVKQV